MVGQSLVFLSQHECFNPNQGGWVRENTLKRVNVYRKVISRRKISPKYIPGLASASFCLKHFACKSDSLSDLYFAEQKNLTFKVPLVFQSKPPRQYQMRKQPNIGWRRGMKFEWNFPMIQYSVMMYNDKNIKRCFFNTLFNRLIRNKRCFMSSEGFSAHEKYAVICTWKATLPEKVQSS